MVNNELFKLIHETTQIILNLEDKLRERKRDRETEDDLMMEQNQILEDMHANLGSLRARTYRLKRRVERMDAKADDEKRRAPMTAQAFDIVSEREKIIKSLEGDPKK